MGYREMLRGMFPKLELNPEDLFFLEKHQIEYFPSRVLREEFSVLLQAYPVIRSYLVSRCPSIESFIEKLPAGSSIRKTVKECCDDFLWEIAEMIVYSKYPEIYDAQVEPGWKQEEIIPSDALAGRIVIDAGAGPGKLSFLLAKKAAAVFAVDPATGFRRFIMETAEKENIDNIYTADGFLHKIPFMDNFADILITSNAIGWHLEDELIEIERVLKPSGSAIHLFRDVDRDSDQIKPLDEVLTSPARGYVCTRLSDSAGIKLKYIKSASVETSL